MDIHNKTSKNLTLGDREVIVSLGILKANEANYLALGADRVELYWAQEDSEFQVTFVFDSENRVTTVRVPRSEVNLHWQKTKEAKRGEYLETMSNIVSDAAAACFTADQNLRVLGVPDSLSMLVDEIASELSCLGDKIDELVTQIEREEA